MKGSEKGLFRTAEGNWGYRFKINVNGTTIERRRITDDDGNPFKTKAAVSRARSSAIKRETQKCQQLSRTMNKKQHKKSSYVDNDYWFCKTIILRFLQTFDYS